jgi:murein L,D-transpeptidase YafK
MVSLGTNRFVWRLLVSLACFLNWALPSAAQAQPKHPKGPSAISERIEEMIGAEMRGWCEEKGVAYPPDKVLFRVFKIEREIEIWAMSEGMVSMKLVATVPVCSMDFLPGPKLEQGDGKTPEGFYHISSKSFGSGSKFYWMWMCLSEASIEDAGEAGNCSCLKICLEYPNDVDKARSKVGLGIRDPGDGICIHGNCVTAGCVSFENRDLLPVYGFAALHHRKRNEDLQFHIFPFRFKGKDLDAVAIDPAIKSRLGEVKTRRFWRNLKMGYDLFEASKLPLKVHTGARLQEDSAGQMVNQLQLVLKEMGHFPSKVNGLFDKATVDAVKAFQKAHSLKPTGRIRKKDTDQLQMYWYEEPATH